MKAQLALANRSQLRDALHLLRKFLMARSAEPLLHAADLAPLESLVKEESYYSASIPRVLLLGKFKAGKSTLVNALLEAPLAATDLFEMTAWLARYWPSENPFCRIISRSGHVTETTPEDFVADCQSRQFSKERLADIAAIDIGTGPSGLAVTLIDAPGSGGMNRDNEKRLVEALRDADLVMWVADVTALGDARESAVVQKLREQDTPIVVVLTKCDFAGEDEIEEAKAFLFETYGLDDVPILATAAGAPRALGVDQLRSFLNSEVATRHSELRARAQQAHEERIAVSSQAFGSSTW